MGKIGNNNYTECASFGLHQTYWPRLYHIALISDSGQYDTSLANVSEVHSVNTVPQWSFVHTEQTLSVHLAWQVREPIDVFFCKFIKNIRLKCTTAHSCMDKNSNKMTNINKFWILTEAPALSHMQQIS